MIYRDLKVAEALRHALALCETDNQRRGVERAQASIATALTALPDFNRAEFDRHCVAATGARKEGR